MIEPLEERRLLSATSPLTSIASFNGTDGSNPSTGVVLSGNTLYGTTDSGGANNAGTIFSVPTTGGTPTLLMSFDKADGFTTSYEPRVIVSGGILYGTTPSGGAFGLGEVFSLPITGGTRTVLGSFNGTNGGEPTGSLAISGNLLYGETATDGNANLSGGIFSLPIGGGSPLPIVTHIEPLGNLIVSGNLLYGAELGSQNSPSGNIEVAQIFSVSIVGGTPKVLTTVVNGYEVSNLLLSGNTLYFESSAADQALPIDNKSIYSLPITGGNRAVLANSTTAPISSFVLSGSTIYGLEGTLFSIPITGGTPDFFVDFNQGWSPNGSIVFANGTLYGVANEALTSYNPGDGTVFSVGVNSQTPAHLEFAVQPNNVLQGMPNPTSVDLKYSDGNVVTSDYSTVTLSVAGGPPHSVLEGTYSTRVVNGVATFSNLSIDEPGTYTLTAVDNISGRASATSASFTVSAIAPTVEEAVYRLYSPVTKEHLYTTDANENSVLGTEGWTKEGQVWHEYSGPMTINGVADTPLYRLYDSVTQQHLWTTDANEYNTLRKFSNWTGEHIAGYIFPSAVAASSALYRVSYPFLPDPHLWTTDPNEYAVLGSTYGWTQEGIVGYVLNA